MCLVFYICGVLTGYLAWRLTSAPRLWDSQEEARFWRTQWVAARSQLDTLTPNED